MSKTTARVRSTLLLVLVAAADGRLSLADADAKQPATKPAQTTQPSASDHLPGMLFQQYPDETKRYERNLNHATRTFANFVDLYLSPEELRDDRPSLVHVTSFGVDEIGRELYVRFRSEDNREIWQIKVCEIVAFRDSAAPPTK